MKYILYAYTEKQQNPPNRELDVRGEKMCIDFKQSFYTYSWTGEN